MIHSIANNRTFLISTFAAWALLFSFGSGMVFTQLSIIESGTESLELTDSSESEEREQKEAKDELDELIFSSMLDEADHSHSDADIVWESAMLYSSVDSNVSIPPPEHV